MEYCAQHALDGMVNVKRRECRTEGCGKRPSFGVAGTKTLVYCARHAPSGMVDACSMKSKTEGWFKKQSFGMATSRTTEYCTQHVRLECDAEGCRESEVGPHHSGKETIGNGIPSGGKHETVYYPLPTQASVPSGGSQGSRKRVRHSEITFTTPKRAVARMSAGGAVTIPNIDVQKSPVQRDSSVKTEVQLSL